MRWRRSSWSRSRGLSLAGTAARWRGRVAARRQGRLVRRSAAGRRSGPGAPCRQQRSRSTSTRTRRASTAFPGWSDLSPGSYRWRSSFPISSRATQPCDAYRRENQAGRLHAAVRGSRRSPTRLQRTSLRRSRAPTSRSICSSSATTATRCSSRCGPAEARKGGRRSSGAWRGSAPSHAKRPGTRAFGQKKYVEPLAEYLASIRGPGSSGPTPVPAAPAADRRGVHAARRHRIRHPARRASRSEHHSRRPAVCLAARHPARSRRARTPITRITSASTSDVSIGEQAKSRNSPTASSRNGQGRNGRGHRGTAARGQSRRRLA